MAYIAFQALMRAIRQQAVETSELWGQNAFPDFAPSGIALPYLIAFWMAGGEANWRVTQDADFVIGIKVVSKSQAEAFIGAQRISELFNDQGTQDRGTNTLSGGANWKITTATQGQVIHLVEQVSGATPLYHEGHRFAFHLEPL